VALGDRLLGPALLDLLEDVRELVAQEDRDDAKPPERKAFTGLLPE